MWETENQPGGVGKEIEKDWWEKCNNHFENT